MNKNLRINTNFGRKVQRGRSVSEARMYDASLGDCLCQKKENPMVFYMKPPTGHCHYESLHLKFGPGKTRLKSTRDLIFP